LDSAKSSRRPSIVTIYFDLTQSPLPQNTNPVKIHIGHSGWQGVLSHPDPNMIFDNDSVHVALHLLTIPSQLPATVDFVFTNGLRQRGTTTAVPIGTSSVTPGKHTRLRHGRHARRSNIQSQLGVKRRNALVG
jgi:hypothetical protein